jgi:NAD(P)H-hydrate repair Nnr-like enzyme with NAD(P)H-hydrate dehydratase domain
MPDEPPAFRVTSAQVIERFRALEAESERLRAEVAGLAGLRSRDRKQFGAALGVAMLAGMAGLGWVAVGSEPELDRAMVETIAAHQAIKWARSEEETRQLERRADALLEQIAADARRKPIANQP